MVAIQKHRTPIPTTPPISYLIGVYFGDGTIYKYKITGDHKKYTRFKFELTVNDEEFRNKVAEILKTTLRNTTYSNKINGYYRCQIVCKKLYDFLNQKVTAHTTIIQKYPSNFLRGFFDSEGGIYFEYKTKVFRIRAYNSDKQLLEYIARLLKQKYNITSSIWINVKKGRKSIINGISTKTTKHCYVLQIVRKKDVTEFMEKIGFSISRKNEVWTNNRM